MKAATPIRPFANGDSTDERTQSKLGLASLLIALLFPLLMLLIFVILLLLQVQIDNEAFTYLLMILGGAIAGVIAHSLGVIMGIAGLRRKENKKLLSAVGIVFNAIPLLLTAIVCTLLVAFLIHPFPLGPK